MFGKIFMKIEILSFAAFADNAPVSFSSCNSRKTFDELVHFVFLPSSGLRSASLFFFGFLNLISIPAAFFAEKVKIEA